MSTLAGRSDTALVVVDVQKAVVADVHERNRVVNTIAGLVDRARAASVPVIWIQHHDDHLERGSSAWEIVDELSPLHDEVVVHKSHNDAFEETSLERELAERSVSQLVVVGAQTEWCIRSTLHGAIARGYDALLVSDAHSTKDMSEEIPASSIIALTNHYWHWHDVPHRTAGTAESRDVSFRD